MVTLQVRKASKPTILSLTFLDSHDDDMEQLSRTISGPHSFTQEARQPRPRIPSRSSSISRDRIKAPKVTEGPAHNIPSNLLEDIRNHQRVMTTQPRRQSTERRKKEQADKEVPVLKQLENLVLEDQDEDEGSDREHITSALYYPHQGLASRSLSDKSSPEKEVVAAIKQAIDSDSPSKRPSLRDPLPSDLEIALVSEEESQYLQGKLSAARLSPDLEDEEPAQPYDPYLSESDISSGYESSTTVEDVTTPTATPKQSTIEKHPTGHAKQPSVGAVELKPFDHQVGGHTTVYSFSRQAVCKQLNSRENEFYETVERSHPEVLDFLPRYIGVLNVTYTKPTKKKRSRAAKTDDAERSEVEQSQESAAEASDANDNASEPEMQKRPPLPTKRVFSQSMRRTPIPQVSLTNNGTRGPLWSQQTCLPRAGQCQTCLG